ncbi:ligase-associated DNA damage response endonuclease PdeM [Sedimentitalea todarodis]|uniref:Ligase-associated DNA damage response endonuclease PdeM n=1 Tax=Sedimentitalea todarodis TaxID=1631240 RepID=A0ABU3V8G4_9RHOB|nr:ligase-associated DNA damage response endonuclease PdeM [Sedimentitalea todarodis]MDU9002460.1 ligase-associated DNA damage response endonuclease PdeM [Sedimentitalea todarodis]
MNGHSFLFSGVNLVAMASGALWWPEQRLLCVSDLHLGKSERIARRGGGPLPPYDTHDTLNRLADDLERCSAETVVCIGDSFDDLDAANALPDNERLWITRLQAGRRWVWIEGNHDPGPVGLGGTHLAELSAMPLTFRHIANPGSQAEVSGHYHPKVQLRLRGRTVSRPAFLVDANRVILPAYGTYTGGLRSNAPILLDLMQPKTVALVTGKSVHAVPMPRNA